MAVKYFKTPFASSGDVTVIPELVQPDGSVSYTQGYGPNYQADPGSDPDALDIERDKMNDLFLVITAALQQYQQHGTPDFITSADNGGSPYSYAKYARVLYDDSGIKAYQSLEDANTALPTDNTKWSLLDATPSGYLLAANNLSDLANLTTALTNLTFAASMGTTGYVKLPNIGGVSGLILQWGGGSISNGASITFPLTFPNAVYRILTSSNTDANGILTAATAATTGFTAIVDQPIGSNGTLTGSWFALGR